MRRALFGAWRRLEWYSAFFFIGLRLAIWLLAFCIVVMIAGDHPAAIAPMILPGALCLILAAAEWSLIRFEQAALKAQLADSEAIAESVANDIRLLRLPLRIILGTAYFISAATSILLTVWIEWAWNQSLHLSAVQSFAFCFGLTFIMSFSSNLALNAWLAAWGASSTVTRRFFRHRLLIDAFATVLVGGLLIPHLQQ